MMSFASILIATFELFLSFPASRPQHTFITPRFMNIAGTIAPLGASRRDAIEDAAERAVERPVKRIRRSFRGFFETLGVYGLLALIVLLPTKQTALGAMLVIIGAFLPSRHLDAPGGTVPNNKAKIQRGRWITIIAEGSLRLFVVLAGILLLLGAVLRADKTLDNARPPAFQTTERREGNFEVQPKPNEGGAANSSGRSRRLLPAEHAAQPPRPPSAVPDLER